MSALDSAKKRATTNFDSVKKGSSHALLALAVKSIDEATAAIEQDDADDASAYAKYWLGVLLLHHILKAPAKELQELQHKLTNASEKQKDAGRAMEKVQARLRLQQLPVLPQPQPQAESERNGEPSSSMNSINDRLRALRDAGLADPTVKRAAHHVPKAASVSVSPTTATSPHAFVPVSSLGPPSPASNSYSFSSTLSSSARHHNLSNIAASTSSSAAASSASSPTFSLRSESEFATSFPSIDELEASFNFPTVPTSPPGSSAAPPTLNGVGYSPFSSPPPPQAPPSLGGTRTSRSHSIASTSRLPSASTSTSPTPPDLSRSSRAPSTSSATRIQKPELPKTRDITTRELKATLDSHLKVLLLDVRNRDEFERKRIDGSGDAVVCIEPSILLREQVTSQAIESALVVGPNQETLVFRNRDKFDSVVIYDENSESVGPPGTPVARLIRAIYDDEVVRRLKTSPYFLVGGLQAWQRDFATDVIVAQASGGTPAVGTHKTPPEVPRHTKPLVSALSTQSPAAPAFFDTRTTAASVTPSASVTSSVPAVSYPSALPNGTGSLPEPAAAATSATPDVTGHSDTRPPESPVTETVRRLNRKPAISRPPSAGPMSAYRRTALHDIQLSPTASTSTASPIQYPSPIRAFSPPALNQSTTSLASSLLSSHDTGGLVQAPPAASVSSSPLARRRSDYLEQSQMPYAGAPAPAAAARIDYPQVIRPPPPVARQDQRPLPAPKPPLIHSDYPVMSWSEMQVATSGLKNLGNTCYMNATIQCLSATVPFARFFTDGRWKTAVNMVNPLGTKGQLASAFATLLHEMWHGDLPYRSPYAFRKTVCSFATQFNNSEQHDCQEFLSALLDGLHEDLNRIIAKPTVETTPDREAELETLAVQIASEQEWQIYQMRDDSLIVDYFQGQFRNRVQCLTCHKTSTTYNSFMYLSLPIPAGRGVSKVSLNQCLDHFVREEVIDRENAWNCPNCKCPRRATTQLSLSRLPPVLLIHLKRFSVKGPFTDKLETVVDFPQRGLDLTNYMPPPLPPGTARPARAGPPLRTDDPRIQVPPYKYDLYAVTNHYGTLTGGHYTALIASRGGWLHCDDSRISEADPQSLTTRAYVLFYRRCM